MTPLAQARIVHVSDLHFGDTHRCQPDRAPADDRPADRGYRSLASMIRGDLQAIGPDRPWLDAHERTSMILAVTGDITDRAASDELGKARMFFDELWASPILGSRLDKDSTFIVPGNHDVIYDEPDAGRRWHPFCDFYGQLLGHNCRPAEAYCLTRVRDYSDKNLIVAEVNSAFDVRKGTPDANRGHVSEGDIERLRDELLNVAPDALQRSVRIALVHHHPIVLPALAEPGRGYDAVHNAQALLAVLREFGFHVILHGHKHFPHAFSFDPVCAWTLEPALPMIVVSGGSAGSKELPDSDGATNCYNAIGVKWNHTARHARVIVETRGLIRHDRHRQPLTPGRWHWKTSRVVDRVLAVEPERRPVPPAVRPRSDEVDGGAQNARSREYERLRGNMIIADVLPSLEPDQGYEVRVRVLAHPGAPRDIPVRVDWCCGKHFEEVAVCTPDKNDAFEACISYWGPMLVCATMQFSDGSHEYAQIYAHVPGTMMPSGVVAG